MTERHSMVRIAAAAVAVVALAACMEQGNDTRDGQASVESAAPDADAPGNVVPDTMPTGAIDATRVVDRAPVAGASPDFDVKAFAGTFSATGAELQLAGDGTYAFTVRAESADADLATTGTWTVEADGTEVLLDPDAKGDPDQRFTIATNDQLVATVGGRVLRRDGT